MLWNDRARRPVLRGACSGGQRTHGDDRACADEGSRDLERLDSHVDEAMNGACAIAVKIARK